MAGFMPMPEPAAGGPMLYGPDGRPLMVSTDRDAIAKIAGGGSNDELRKVLGKVDWDALEGEVAKRVRSQAASLTQVWDPRRGKPKPTSVTYDTLRMMARRNEWCAAIVKTRKNQIGKTDWSIKPVDEDDSSPSTRKLVEEVTKLLKRPSMHGSRPNSRSWRQFIRESLEDVLVLDAGAIEKERNGRKWIAAMYPVDGATIAPNIDDRGGYHDDAYVQMVEGQVTARFGMEDLLYVMDNPQTDVRFAGYGFSPLENLIVSVTAELYASKYNASYFEKGAIPEGMINLGEEVAPEDVDAFRLYWMNEIMGKPWAIPIVGGKGVEWIEWRQSNKDMEYMLYQQWLLKKMCAVYQIAPQEIGELEDVNRSTAQEQQESNSSKSLEPILTLYEDAFEVEVIGEYGLGVGDLVKFEFDKEDQNEQWELQKWQALVQEGAGTRNEMREALGEEPSEEEGADMLLVAGQLNPLPTEQDAQLLSATGQQQQQQDQQEHEAQMAQDQGSGPGTMPWKPADPSDPDVQSAQGQHDLQNGLGPKQLPVGKTAVPFVATHFHVAPRSVRRSIRRNGLDHRLAPERVGRGDDPDYEPGNYLFADEAEAAGVAHLKRDETGVDHDVWHVNALTHDLQDDRHAGEFRSAVFTREPLAPRDVWLPTVGKAVPWDRDPALTGQHDRLDGVFDRKSDQLLSTLERLLGVPLDPAEVEQLTQ